MSQSYHNNARTNEHAREIIQKSVLSNVELAGIYNVSVQTISKHKNRDFTQDKSSRPNTIKYALNPLEKEIIRVVRTLTWMDLDDLSDTISDAIPHANRSNVYRTLRSFEINKIPEDKKEQAQKFKEYKPGFLHIDVTYLPKIDGIRYYLFVAIDRATRLLCFRMYKNKTSNNSVEFLRQCKEFYPFYISHVLTDNRLEFTDRFVGKTKKASGNHKFDLECKQQAIVHRLTATYTPQTKAMAERVNGTIKNSIIKVETYKNIKEMQNALNEFLIYYNVNRKHGGFKKELKVRTPYEAVRCWFNLEPEIFKILPDDFYLVALGGSGITL